MTGPILAAAVAFGVITLVSIEEEIEIGRAAQAQMRQQTPELRDRAAAAWLRDVGRRLARAAPGARYPYSFTIADAPAVNAFSLPGGPVWINRGVLERVADESQAAAVMAHEVAHIAERHGADRLAQGMVARLGLGLLGALLGNVGGAGTAQAAAALLTGGAFLRFSRDEERQADLVGLAILVKAGWDPRGATGVLELLVREEARNPSVVRAFLSSHPSPGERLAYLAPEATRRRGGRRDSGRFKAVAARLQRAASTRDP